MKTKSNCKVCGAEIIGKTIHDHRMALFNHLRTHPTAKEAISKAIEERSRLQKQRQEISAEILNTYGYKLAGF